MCWGFLLFLFLMLRTTLKVGIFILILSMRELKLIEFKVNGPRTHSSLVKDLKTGHISLSRSPDVFNYILFI